MKRNSLFDNWFVYNYQRLRNIFGRYLHEDAFHDAYLVMKREVVISEIEILNPATIVNLRELRALFFRRVQEVQAEMYSQG